MKLFPGFGRVVRNLKQRYRYGTEYTGGQARVSIRCARNFNFSWHPFSFACPSSFKVIIVTQILVMLRIVQS